MKYTRWRFPVAMLVPALFVAVFLLRGDEWIGLRKAVLGIQFTTDIARVGGKMLLGALILAATFALGRWYCSLLCPAGLAQDLFARIGRRLGLARLRFARPSFAVNVVFMILAILFGGVALLDPAALFGWLATGLAGDGGRVALGIAAVVLVVIPLFWGRLFCDVACPAGTLLRLIGRLSSGRRMRIDADACVSCGCCDNVCPTRCLDAKAGTIDASRCVLCFECAAACRPGAVQYRARGAGETNGGAAPDGEMPDGIASGGRRNFLGSAGAALLGGGYIFSREAKRRLGVVRRNPALAAPPGSGGLALHSSTCVGCQACVPACPVRILRADGLDSRPVMDYNYGYCQYSCMNCVHSCPSGVFADISLEEKQRTRVAKVELDIDRCVVTTLNQACGACAEVCPTHAVTMVARDGSEHTVPDFDPAYCIGCGACYHACPVTPRAFTVAGLAYHETSAGIRDTAGHGAGAESDAPPVDWENAGEMTDFPF